MFTFITYYIHEARQCSIFNICLGGIKHILVLKINEGYRRKTVVVNYFRFRFFWFNLTAE